MVFCRSRSVEDEGLELVMTVIFNGAGANANLGRIFKTDLDSVLFTVAWASLAAMFSFSIAMVVWGRNGDGTLKF